jgi:hypothetical protein
MTDTSVVTPLRPAASIEASAPKDPRAAARQAKKRSQNNSDRDAKPVRRRKSTPAAIVEAPSIVPVALDAPSGRIPWAVYPLAGTTIALMGVSLSHLSDGVEQLTTIPLWQSVCMAIGIDAMLVSVALAMLTSPPEVKRDIGKVAHTMEAGTLVMSAGLNALAFTGGMFDLAHWPQIAFGCFVPAAISGATYILARLTRR